MTLHYGRRVLAYLLHLLAAAALAPITALMLAGAVYRFKARWGTTYPYSSDLHFAAENLFLFSLIVGLGSGYLYNLRPRHLLAAWVWLPPALFLLFRMVTFQNYSVIEGRWISVWQNFFGSRCVPPYSFEEFVAGFRCFDQLQVTAPAITAAGYAVGAVLAIKYPFGITRRQPPVEEQRTD
jgi:hypothetical protein